MHYSSVNLVFSPDYTIVLVFVYIFKRKRTYTHDGVTSSDHEVYNAIIKIRQSQSKL